MFKHVSIKDILKYLGLSIIFSILFSACGPIERAEQPIAAPATQSQTQQEAPVVTQDEPEKTDLTGTWVFDDDNLKFVANVTDHIEVTMHAGDSKGLYWQGTFPTSVEDGAEIDSKADTKALQRSMFGSQDKTKNFKFEDGALKYEFTMMGVTRTVVLEK